MAKQESPDWVRVKDTRTGDEVTVSSRIAHKDHFEVLDKPAVDRSGRPLASKPLKNLEPLRGREEEITVQEPAQGSRNQSPAASASGSATEKEAKK